ncbi:MAG: diaminopimelate decarboxylase [Candidatus Melainabacteria bacterium]
MLTMEDSRSASVQATDSDVQPSPNTSLYPATYEVRANGHPYIGGVDMLELVNTHGTPVYVLDEATIRGMATAYTTAFEGHYPGDAMVLYASKANLSMGLCKLAEQEGLGLDVVSGGELYTALQAGFPVENIFFNGNNKTLDELELAIHHRIGRISVDNFHELTLIHQIAAKKKVKVNVILRITPGIECHTHDYIKTGQVDTKFGFDMSQLSPAIEKILNDYKETIVLQGLHAHIGSQIFEVRPFEDLVQFMLNVFYNIRESYGITLSDLNLGGGYGVMYMEGDDPPNIPKTMQRIIDQVVRYAEKIDFPLPRILVEPGRSLVATAGVTLYRIGSTKTVPNVRKYVAVDGGMGDNIRPALYQAEYTARVANKLNDPIAETVRVVGKYCESGDVLIDSVAVPAVEAGDVLMVFATGAYNYAMASNYNRVPRPPVVLVENGHSHVLVQRESLDTILQHDLIPAHLQGAEDEAR